MSEGVADCGFVVKDSGQRQNFETGAKRDTQDGKPRFDLVPPLALQRVAMHYTNGAKKYDEHNWVKGIPRSRCIASALRHLYQLIMGDRTEDHASAVVFNMLCIIHYEEVGRTDLNDQFNWNTGKPVNENSKS